MRILLVTSHFYPENFKANDIAFELAKRNHQVTVLTPIPDYPQGKFYQGYGVFKKRREKIKGVDVIRTLVTPRRDGSPKWLIPNYLSHTFFSTLRSLRLAFGKKFDAVIVHETSPIMVGIPGMIVKRIQKIPMLFWVLDLWPESVTAAGNVKSSFILNPLKKLTNLLYRHSDRILISSKGFRKSILKLGNHEGKIEFFPNWVDAQLEDSNIIATPEFPSGFNVLFAGNIGDAQDMPHILEAAKILKDSGINFILVGDGRGKKAAEDYKNTNNLSNVYFMGRHPLEAMPSFFAKADLLLLALKDEEIFKLTVPAKLQAYMSAGKPIIAMINGEGGDVIREADCGWSVPAEHSKELAEQILQIASLSSHDLQQKGRNGRVYSEQNYTLSKCIDNLEKMLKEECQIDTFAAPVST